MLAEPWGGARHGQGLPGRTGREHPLGARPVAPRAFTAEGPTGWRCHDTRLSRHCPALKPTGSGAGLRGSRAVPHSSGFPVGKGSGSLGGFRASAGKDACGPGGPAGARWPTEAQHHASPKPCPQKASCPAAAPLILGGPPRRQGLQKASVPKAPLTHGSPQQPQTPGSPPTG